MRLFCNCGKSMAIKNNLEELIVYLLFGSVRVLATLQSVSRILEDIFVFMTLGGGKCIFSKKMERPSQKFAVHVRKKIANKPHRFMQMIARRSATRYVAPPESSSRTICSPR